MKNESIMTHSFYAASELYSNGNLPSALVFLLAEKKRIEQARQTNEVVAGMVDGLAMYSINRMIELCQQEIITNDFHVFYQVAGTALQAADDELSKLSVS